MRIPTEPIGSIPRPGELIAAITAPSNGADLKDLYDKAVSDTLSEFEKTGSSVVTDGEQTKSSFATYPLEGLSNLAAQGMRIDFQDGHFRQLPLLTSGPFRYSNYAVKYPKAAQKQTTRPIKQAVISASALTLIYPQSGIPGYPKAEFMEELLNECEKDIRQCLAQGAYKVQMDFTEGRLSLKLDPSGGVLKHFIDVNNQVFNRFTKQEQQKLGVHVCPGGDRDSTHSADIDYADFLPRLFDLNVGSFYLQLASEPDRIKVLKIIKQYLKPGQTAFIGVIDVLNPAIETKEQVRDRILEAANYIPVSQLGTTDDCGFSPFCDEYPLRAKLPFRKSKRVLKGQNLLKRNYLINDIFHYNHATY
jgi:5-methyltetrahydropteroyltriglutamate--homocysteine methyltransferase